MADGVMVSLLMLASDWGQRRNVEAGNAVCGMMLVESNEESRLHALMCMYAKRYFVLSTRAKQFFA